jgi:hypothetical protein
MLAAAVLSLFGLHRTSPRLAAHWPSVTRCASRATFLGIAGPCTIPKNRLRCQFEHVFQFAHKFLHSALFEGAASDAAGP